jgi:hypothetical protein
MLASASEDLIIDIADVETGTAMFILHWKYGDIFIAEMLILTSETLPCD